VIPSEFGRLRDPSDSKTSWIQWGSEPRLNVMTRTSSNLGVNQSEKFSGLGCGLDDR
jgi:hypothetical protein